MDKFTLRDSVAKAVEKYLEDLDGEIPRDGIYHRVIREAEFAIFDFVYEMEAKNQSNATKLLGISRATFRKKIKEFGLL